MSQASYNLTQIMMTLSAISYEETESRFQELLASTQYATQGEWKVVWGPQSADKSAYRAFVVEHAQTNSIALVIRGSVLSLEHPIQTIIDWWNDLGVFHLKSFSGNAADGKIAKGTQVAMDDIVAMKDPKEGSLAAFLTNRKPANIFVTGHSLGGCQASVLTLWARNLKVSGTRVVAYTFAGPSAGDDAFAKQVGTTDFNRVWNQWDFVPQGFQGTLLDQAVNWYPKPGEKMTVLEWGIVEGGIWMLPDPNPYIQPAGNGTELKHSMLSGVSFASQAGDQHDKNMYLRLLGAPEVQTNVAKSSTS